MTKQQTEKLNNLSYEEAFAQLEAVLNALEIGDLPLDEALNSYESGAALAAYCAGKLDEAELRVKQWQPDDSTATFEDWENRTIN